MRQARVYTLQYNTYTRSVMYHNTCIIVTYAHAQNIMTYACRYTLHTHMQWHIMTHTCVSHTYIHLTRIHASWRMHTHIHYIHTCNNASTHTHHSIIHTHAHPYETHDTGAARRTNKDGQLPLHVLAAHFAHDHNLLPLQLILGASTFHMCMCILFHVCMCIRLCIHVCTCIRVRICMRMSTHTHVLRGGGGGPSFFPPTRGIGGKNYFFFGEKIIFVLEKI